MKKFYFLLIAMLVGLSANAAYYLVGSFNGWSNPGTAQLVSQGDGTYKYTHNGTFEGEFKITQGDWTDSKNFASNGSQIEVDKVYNLGGGGGGNIVVKGSVVNPTFTFNPTAKTLLIEGEKQEASYPTLYVVGEYNGWGDGFTSQYEMTREDAVYTLHLDALSGQFKIAGNNWYPQFANPNTPVKAGEPITLTSSGDNCKLASDLTDVTVTFNYESQQLLVEGTVVGGGEIVDDVITYQIHGSFTGDWASTDLTEKDGAWSIENFEVTAASANFGIRQMTNGKQTVWYAADGANVVTGAGTYKCKVNGTNFSISAGTYGFSFDPETMILTVTGEGGEIEYPALYVVGSYNGWASGFTADYEMACENGIYTLHLDSLTGEFKIAGEGWTPEYAYTDAPIVAGTPVTATGTNGNCTLAAEKGLSDVTITFNYLTGELLIEGTEITEAVEAYFLKGSFETEDAWITIPMTEMEDNAGTFVASVKPAVADVKFIIYKTVNDVEAAWYKGVVGEISGTVTMTTDGADASVELVPDNEYAFAFVPETLALTITQTSGVNVIAIDENVAVEYYNLQGVRVAEPANGLYIVKRGNNVSKEIVR